MNEYDVKQGPHGPFPQIGLFAKYNTQDVVDTFNNLIYILERRAHTLFVEKESSALMDLEVHSNITVIPGNEIGKHINLAIVVGGDGSLLRAARSIIKYQIPLLGIHRGTLGFLADLRPNNLENTIHDILDGEYQEEHRSLLSATILRHNKNEQRCNALNDIVLYHGKTARMIEFEIFIDNQFVLHQRADGMITATPTGSTAYALSAGGPILYPTLNAISLVPMFPHTLSSRPIVVQDSSKIHLIVSPKKNMEATLSADSQEHFTLSPGDEIFISKHPHHLRLLHPKSYNYYSLLRKKLGWNTNLTSDR